MQHKAVDIGLNNRIKLGVLVFFQFAIWGAYLSSMGRYLTIIGLGSYIKWFFVMNGIVSLFMPSIVGTIADRYIQAQKTLSLCHFISGLFIFGAGLYCMNATQVLFGPLFALYACGIAFFFPTIALSNSVAFNVIEQCGGDPVIIFPPIRLFGTIGFIVSMLTVNFVHINGISMQDSYMQFMLSGVLSIILAIFSLTLPACAINSYAPKFNIKQTLRFDSFILFREKQMAIFFIFSVLMGTALQISNGYANTYLNSFGANPDLAHTFAVKNSNALLSISQLSETLCFLLVPFFMKRFGIKLIMIISMIAWSLRFVLLGLGTPQMPGVLLIILSCIVYGIAFDFFNISGSLFVNQKVDKSMRSGAQGLFMMMSSGIGASIGMIGAGVVVDHYVFTAQVPNWSSAWFVFAGYMIVLTILLILFFKEDHNFHTNH